MKMEKNLEKSQKQAQLKESILMKAKTNSEFNPSKYLEFQKIR